MVIERYVSESSSIWIDNFIMYKIVKLWQNDERKIMFGEFLDEILVAGIKQKEKPK